MPGFRWKLGDYVGGAQYTHQSYKPYLVLNFDDDDEAGWATGEHLVQPGDTSDIVISGLGFRPTLLVLIGYRPRDANGGRDDSFGQRTGGMTFGVAGHASVGPAWDAGTAYSPGDVVRHEGARYVATSPSTGSEPPSANWSFLAVTEFTGSSRIRTAFEPKYSYWNEDCCFRVVHDFGATEVLKLNAAFDADGFTLSVPVNLYDDPDYVAWLAMSGDFVTGVMTTGDTSLPYDGEATGAMFLSTKHAPGETFRTSKWDHMTGFASVSGAQAAIWGGGRNDNWDWTTERWEDDRAIVLADSADGSFFAGVNYRVGGRVTGWSGGVQLDWPVFDNSEYRVGYVIAGNGVAADMGILETNWDRRQGGPLNDFPDEDANWQPTAIRPDVILMAATNYNFVTGNLDAFDNPRSPGEWWKGGSGGLGWHAAPFSDAGNDAYGVHTFGNSVAELGRYANSGTQYLRRYILAGQGANSQPPAYHQHSVNVIPNPRIVGMNWREADRRGHNIRGLQNVSDDRL